MTSTHTTQLWTPKLEIKEVGKTFKTKSGETSALEKTSFSINEGEFVTILGPSGCGKSTVLRIVGGLEEATTGEVLLDGKAIQGPGPDRGMVFQSYTLYPWLTVKENISFGLKLKGSSQKEQDDVARHYLQLIGLEGFENHYPIQLSGGMKQRVAIARSLANDPEILLMDEPFGALDAQTRNIMQEVLLKAWEESKKTILFITHDVDESIFLADSVYVMTARPGRLKKKIPITLERPRQFSIKGTTEFANYKQELLELIREESLKSI
ncbi:NitT/TauT family transport system ATP-binding protein/sulfonate transport system ATP-binding protein [Bacillus tianshenii]|uniref:NitT/TauT family transport system ATP-binding protein/sulfonate transport system ATP-binding protein n=1 Tax=Sutcliffiella tianshenii TaxID=1463404 RepID=A0ABS2NYJ8_9BACI|nr:ABC transporter ATP-binding protein [Bacillus tianshenii]MBM7619717.1 NitT/TauT family transport system ATP-binding protein/sulfonate transport system ATP-binding protein [Bacillus tianshenii]